MDNKGEAAILAAISDMRVDIERRFTSLETKDEARAGRCNSHGAALRAVEERQAVVERAIGYDPNSETTIYMQVQRDGKFIDRVIFVFEIIAWFGGGAAVIYGGLAILVNSVIPHIENFERLVKR